MGFGLQATGYGQSRNELAFFFWPSPVARSPCPFLT